MLNQYTPAIHQLLLQYTDAIAQIKPCIVELKTVAEESSPILQNLKELTTDIKTTLSHIDNKLGQLTFVKIDNLCILNMQVDACENNYEKRSNLVCVARTPVNACSGDHQKNNDPPSDAPTAEVIAADQAGQSTQKPIGTAPAAGTDEKPSEPPQKPSASPLTEPKGEKSKKDKSIDSSQAGPKGG